jgi:hypothetical protein
MDGIGVTFRGPFVQSMRRHIQQVLTSQILNSNFYSQLTQEVRDNIS